MVIEGKPTTLCSKSNSQLLATEPCGLLNITCPDLCLHEWSRLGGDYVCTLHPAQVHKKDFEDALFTP